MLLQLPTRCLIKKDEDKLEGVQRRATKVPLQLREEPYESRLKQLKLPTLKYRRKRSDILQGWRNVHGVDNIPESAFFERSDSGRTRGHSLKFKKGVHIKSKQRGKAFSQRTVKTWNSLPDSVVTSDQINTMKSRLEKWWKDDPDKYAYVAEWEKSPVRTSHERLLTFDAREGH